MTTSLHDRLADLAGDAPPGGPVPDLWDRAVRHHRVRRAGTVAIAAVAVLALVALGALDWWRSRPEPAPAGSAPALPTRIWMPEKWLPGTDDAGPLGQLAALVESTRGTWSGDEYGVAGMSATTGEYRFLDLPDAALSGVDPSALSPDGRQVAYWITGETTDSPSTDSAPVVGVAVYDTTTEEVVRAPIATAHGLIGDSLAWLDESRVVFTYGQNIGVDDDPASSQAAASSAAGVHVWEPASGTEPGRLLGSTLDDDTIEDTNDGTVLAGAFGGAAVVRPDGRRVQTSLSVGAGFRTAAVDATGSRIAWIRTNVAPRGVVVAPVREGPADRSPVRGVTDALAVEAWPDSQHVAVVQRASNGDSAGSVLRIVDVRTGEGEQVLRYPDSTSGTATELAEDLLGSPALQRPRPPDPLDPRKVSGAAAAVVVGAMLALLAWRRRVRA